MVAHHYERDFDMIFQLRTAQNVVAEHYGRIFYVIFHLRWLKLGSRTIWKRF